MLRYNLKKKIDNIHIYPTSYKYESRINKEVTSLINLKIFKKILIVGIWEPELPEYEKQTEFIHVLRIKTGFEGNNSLFFKVLNILIFQIKVFQKLRLYSVKFINAHSLLVLPLSFLLKLKTKAKLIYDVHELETERVGLSSFSKYFLKKIEKYFINYIDEIIVVSKPISNWYLNEYKLEKCHVIKNSPYIKNAPEKKSSVFRKKFKINEKDIIYIYQGILTKERGIHLLLDTFKNLKKSNHIVFMGYGPLKKILINESKKYSNIHFQDAVNVNEIMKYSSSADIGLLLTSKFQGLSYKYSLANKIHEYLMAGLPILVSNHFEYTSEILKKFNSGWSINSTKNNLLNFINNTSKEDILKKHKYVKNHSKTIGWEHEEKKFRFIYNCKS